MQRRGNISISVDISLKFLNHYQKNMQMYQVAHDNEEKIETFEEFIKDLGIEYTNIKYWGSYVVMLFTNDNLSSNQITTIRKAGYKIGRITI